MDSKIFDTLIIQYPEELPEYKGKNDISYIYFLWYEDELVYIGETTNLENRINQHKQDKLFNNVTYQTLDNVTSNERKLIERKNIEYHKPIFNDDTNSVLKRSDFCYCRNKGKGRYYYTNKLEQNEVYTSYYNGNTLEQIEILWKEIHFYTDGKLVKKITKRDNQTYKISLKDNGLQIEIEIIIKPEKEKKIVTYKNPKLTLHLKMRFGKYKGSSVQAILLTDREYVRWLIKAYEGEVCSTVKEELRRIDNRK